MDYQQVLMSEECTCEEQVLGDDHKSLSYVQSLSLPLPWHMILPVRAFCRHHRYPSQGSQRSHLILDSKLPMCELNKLVFLVKLFALIFFFIVTESDQLLCWYH